MERDLKLVFVSLRCVPLAVPNLIESQANYMAFGHHRLPLSGRNDSDRASLQHYKYRGNSCLRALDYRVKNFTCTSGLSFCPCLFDAPEILLRAIDSDLLINAVEKLCGLALLKVRRMPTRYWRSFGTSAVYVTSFRWVFGITDQAVLVYWLRHTKINTQLHTTVKVEEIFKVIYQGNLPELWIFF